MRTALLDLSRVPVIVWEVLRGEGFPPNCAIAATRVTTIALTELGIYGARPVACQLDAFSSATVRMLASAQGRGSGVGGLSVAEQERCRQQGGVWVSLVNESPGPGYSGHLVTVVEDGWLLDPAVPQVSRAERGFVVKPLAHRLDDEQPALEPVVVDVADGGMLVYRLEPTREDFHGLADWQNVDLLPTVSRAIDRLRREAATV